MPTEYKSLLLVPELMMLVTSFTAAERLQLLKDKDYLKIKITYEDKDAQDVGRTRDIVGEEKEIDENILSTEDVLSTDKEKVSTTKEKVSTDRPIVSTDGSKVSTDSQRADVSRLHSFERPEEDSLDTPMEEEEELPEPWILFTDGSSCTDDSEAGLILTNPEGMEFTYALRFRFDATNNEAEYEALIVGLRIAEQMGVKNLQANVDSRLVANQVNGTIKRKVHQRSRGIDGVGRREEEDTWMTTIYNYLAEETLPADMKKARAIKRKSWWFAVINGILYKKSFLGPWLRQNDPSWARLCELEVRIRQKSQENRQKRANTDTRTEERARAGSQSQKVNLGQLSKFGLPREIISDNGKQFRDNPFKDWCEKLCIRQHFASVKHPQTNGLVERANRSLGEGIKARLGARNKKWMEELSHVLWAHRTMIKSSNGDTPFSLTYGTEAVIPAEIGMPTLRTAEVDLVQNNEALEINLDLLEERREQAAIREAKSKARMEKYYNSKVKNTSFKPGDLVYRNNDASRTEDTGKLGPKWEGPYEVTKALGKGAYKLRDRDGKQLPRTWNVSNLKKCYIHKM
ncbi:reverse transcriptase domain-containing protein [Tanacetum coccineum]